MLSLTLQLKHIGRDRKIAGVENRFAAFQERRCLHLDSQHKYHLSVIASSPRSIPNLLIIRIEGVVIRKPHFRLWLHPRAWLPLGLATSDVRRRGHGLCASDPCNGHSSSHHSRWCWGSRTHTFHCCKVAWNVRFHQSQKRR